MKILLKIALVIVGSSVVGLSTLAADTNAMILEKPYQELTEVVIKNFQEQEETLVKMQNANRTEMLKLRLQLLNQILRARDLDLNPLAHKQIPLSKHSPPGVKQAITNLDVETVTNADDRQAYEEVLRFNRELRLRVNFAFSLKRLEVDYSDELTAYARSKFKNTAEDIKELSECLNLMDDENYKASLKEKLRDLLTPEK